MSKINSTENFCSTKKNLIEQKVRTVNQTTVPLTKEESCSEYVERQEAIRYIKNLAQ